MVILLLFQPTRTSSAAHALGNEVSNNLHHLNAIFYCSSCILGAGANIREHADSELSSLLKFKRDIPLQTVFTEDYCHTTYHDTNTA